MLETWCWDINASLLFVLSNIMFLTYDSIVCVPLTSNYVNIGGSVFKVNQKGSTVCTAPIPDGFYHVYPCTGPITTRPPTKTITKDILERQLVIDICLKGFTENIQLGSYSQDALRRGIFEVFGEYSITHLGNLLSPYVNGDLQTITTFLNVSKDARVVIDCSTKDMEHSFASPHASLLSTLSSKDMSWKGTKSICLRSTTPNTLCPLEWTFSPSDIIELVSAGVERLDLQHMQLPVFEAISAHYNLPQSLHSYDEALDKFNRRVAMSIQPSLSSKILAFEDNDIGFLFEGDAGSGKSYAMQLMTKDAVVSEIDSISFLKRASLDYKLRGIRSPLYVMALDEYEKLGEEDSDCFKNMTGDRTQIPPNFRIVITTNMPTALIDPAIYRPGRLLRIEVPPLTLEDIDSIYPEHPSRNSLVKARVTMADIHHEGKRMKPEEVIPQLLSRYGTSNDVSVVSSLKEAYVLNLSKGVSDVVYMLYENASTATRILRAQSHMLYRLVPLYYTDLRPVLIT